MRVRKPPRLNIMTQMEPKMAENCSTSRRIEVEMLCVVLAVLRCIKLAIVHDVAEGGLYCMLDTFINHCSR